MIKDTSVCAWYITQQIQYKTFFFFQNINKVFFSVKFNENIYKFRILFIMNWINNNKNKKKKKHMKKVNCIIISKWIKICKLHFKNNKYFIKNSKKFFFSNYKVKLQTWLVFFMFETVM